MATSSISSEESKTQPSGLPLALLSLMALGVVYGDIGTSHAIRECFHGEHAVDVSPANVLGVLSLVFWSLTIVFVSISAPFQCISKMPQQRSIGLYLLW